ncbi:hypothetical protein [Reyranella sp.]|uniref:hypothetical protein n=1 Tax=Reyranella sp. TaxID=1929291 RepID=UPI003D1350C5
MPDQDNAVPPPPTAPAVGAPALPALADCTAAVATGNQTGVERIPAVVAQLSTACPELAAILQLAPVTLRIDSYRRHDEEAIDQQAKLKREATLANLCLLGAGVVSALVLLATSLAPENATQLYVLGLLIIVLGAVGAFFSHIARDQGRAGRWLAERGTAEVARLDVFKEAARRAADAGPRAALYGLALVMTHLLNDQRLWMIGRASRHRKSSVRTSLLSGVAVSLAFVGGSGAILASQSQIAQVALWLVLAGSVGAALAAYATNREALLRDRANAERYEKAVVALDRLAERVDDIADRVRAGEAQAVVAFTDAVADQLASEHTQWLEGTAQADAVLDKLDGQLRQLVADRNRGNPNR